MNAGAISHSQNIFTDDVGKERITDPVIKPHFIFSGRPLSQLSRMRGIAIPTVETLPMANRPGLENTAGPSSCTYQDRLSEYPACHRRRSFLNEPTLACR